MKKFNICVKKTYTKGEEEKATWPSVGSLVHFPATADKEEGYKLELNMFPQKFYVFENKPKEDGGGYPSNSGQGIDLPTKEIDPLDIPY